MNAPLAPNESARLQVLRRREILDTTPEPHFDDLTRLAAQICGTPVATISFLDGQRQWFKPKVGMTTTETPVEFAFCAHGILQAGVFIIPDARVDERFAGHPLVTGDSKVCFYAGVPLVTADGQALGMLSVTDQIPRELSQEQMKALQALGRQVMAQLELRLSLAEMPATPCPAAGSC